MNVTLIVLAVLVLIIAIVCISCVSCSPRESTYPPVAIRRQPLMSDDSVYASYV